jgi:UDPglucose--hexose-1-phosphate uridylyltransferase
MDQPQIQDVLSAYRERILDLKRDERFRYVLLHKTYGEGQPEVADHSHSHIIATPITPTRVKYELMSAMEYYQYKERCLFCDIIYQELSDEERVVASNEKFVAISPFAARSPFEVWLLPRSHETFFEWNNEHKALAAILKDVLQRINSVLNTPNYVMVLHSGPNIATGKLRGYWRTLERDYHWHIEITPRFRGFTSFDIGSGFPINAISPEQATRILKDGKLT